MYVSFICRDEGVSERRRERVDLNARSPDTSLTRLFHDDVNIMLKMIVDYGTCVSTYALFRK